MTPFLFFVIIFIPAVVGGILLWLVFRNINRKYCALFVKLIEAAQKNPNGIMSLLRTGSDTEKYTIVKHIAGIDSITRVEMLKAGRKSSLVRLITLSGIEERIYTVELSCDDTKSWGITKFVISA